MLPTDGELTEQALLVARGVRLIADVGTCEAFDDEMVKAATRVERCAHVGAIPFVFARNDSWATCGYDAQSWALERFQWISTDRSIPDAQAHRIAGMLHGYASEAIRDFKAAIAGRRFDDTASPSRATS